MTNRRRMQGVIFVIVFHLLAVYALVMGLANSTIDLLKGPLEAAVVEEQQADDKPPPPPPPDFKPPPPVVAPPEVNIDLSQASAATNTISTQAKVAVTESSPPRPRGNFSGAMEEYYPAISKRLNEEGSVTIHLTITAEGEPKDVTIVKSSGSQRLDEATIPMVLARWRYYPAKGPDGKPIEVEKTYKVTWKLRG